MSSLGLVFDIAKDALSAQRYGLDVTAHNIANVNTPGYSRQNPVYEAKIPTGYGELLFGRGVDTSTVMRTSDQFVENRLMQQQSGLLYSKEMESYVKILEGIFNENSQTGISSLMAGFWNLWQDISNNPSGSSERSALYEYSVQLSEQLNLLDTEMNQLEIDLTNAVAGGIGKINQITSEIAEINRQIPGMETGSIANDLRDKRNELLSELSGYIDTKSFEQENGSLTIVTARGCVLVSGTNSYDLTLGGTNGNRVLWQGSGGNNTDITSYIGNGKLGGWLDMRDQILAKYELDLDAFAKELAWSVNLKHSQGIGLAALSTVTGTYAVTTPAAAITASGLSYQDKVDDSNKTFNIWLYDAAGDPYDSDPGAPGLQGNPITITVTSGMTINGLVAAINGGTGIQASLNSQNRMAISIDAAVIPSGTFAFSDDTSNVLAALGINTFFSGSSAGNIAVNDSIGSDINLIAAARINADGSFAAGDNRNAMAVSDIQYASQSISRWTCDRINGNTEGSTTSSLEDYYHSMVGSIGIASAGISRNKSFNEVMVSKLGDIRDGISAVSLDEEMTNLIKFQQAYAAAAKLISTADEMLDTLLSVK
ncbi:MAG: flagellar hook-associated protein FlgK [Proteobacteria bacterium]|nr:flagellar hook-associated protein FlgK [Pseudomonadota bacterium]